MPGHALEIFNETGKVEIYHHINQFEINPFYYEEVQFHIQRGVHSIETKAVNCLLIFEKQFTDCTKINLDMRASGQCSGLRVGRPGFQSWPGQGVVPLRKPLREKKMRAPLLGLAKSTYYYEEVQFHIQRGVHSIETKAVNCLLIFEKQFTDCTKINLNIRASLLTSKQ